MLLVHAALRLGGRCGRREAGGDAKPKADAAEMVPAWPRERGREASGAEQGGGGDGNEGLADRVDSTFRSNAL
jgi:hypothetical protein